MNIEKINYNFAKRMDSIPVSFIREILKVTSQPDVISFAGGLPNPKYFPGKALQESAVKVLSLQSGEALQYASSEGYIPLREFIARRYAEKYGINVHSDEIIITNGSQQAMDLAAKAFINPGDKMLMENPSYLGAIQCFSAYQPSFRTVDLAEGGIDLNSFSKILNQVHPKLFYCIPNFQNPSGKSYTLETRKEIAGLVGDTNTLIIEDDPYGEISFEGTLLPPIKKFLPGNTILLGSFSKIISPGIRLGWAVANRKIIEKMVILKQASDLHSNYLSQRILYEYLMHHNLDDHLKIIKQVYKRQRDIMIEMIRIYFPENTQVSIPEGGMFLWVTLPEKINTYDKLKDAGLTKILYVPGRTFYLNNMKDNTMRLNFSNTNEDDIRNGIMRLGKLLKDL